MASNWYNIESSLSIYWSAVESSLSIYYFRYDYNYGGDSNSLIHIPDTFMVVIYNTIIHALYSTWDTNLVVILIS